MSALSVEFGDRPDAPACSRAEQSFGRPRSQLPAIHRMHLMDLARIGALMQKVEVGLEEPSALATGIQSLNLTDNMRRFGTLCGRECQMLTYHHDAEEHSLFPQLVAQDRDALGAVVSRLRAEHKIVHELLIRLEIAAAALAREPGQGQFSEARAVFAQLEKVVRAHFAYEEDQLDAAIAQFIDGV